MIGNSLLWLLSLLVVKSLGQTVTTSNHTNNVIVVVDEEVVWNPNIDLLGTIIDQTTIMTDFENNSTLNSTQEAPCNELPTEEKYLDCLRTFAFEIDTMEWILISCHSVVFVTGLVGNALVCIAVYTNYSMRTVTNIYIVNLAIADFLVILVCLPPSVLWDVTNTWFFGNTLCKFITYFQNVSVTVAVLTLTLISIDRWYAICFPLRYRTKISRAIASVLTIWLVAFLSDVPEFMTLQAVPLNRTVYKIPFDVDTVLFTQCEPMWDKSTDTQWFLGRIIALYVLPLCIMTVAYFKIVRVLWKSDTIPGHRESRNYTYSTKGYVRGTCLPTNSSTMGQLQARRKAAKMLVAVVVIFALCFLPIHLISILSTLSGFFQYGTFATAVSLFSKWLCYANSAVNPIIYNFMSGKFRKEFRNALEKCRCTRVRVEDRFLNQNNTTTRLNNISPSMRSNYQLTSVSRHQTLQTTFIENGLNGGVKEPMLSGKDQSL
ncbi:NPFFR2.2 family protein [Megaselia abdita]